MTSTTMLGMMAACCTTFSFLPQAVQTIRTRDTSGISLGMYALFALGTLLWLAYGVLTANAPVYCANGVTLAFALVILGYKLRYK